jgi:hypothetical protein
MMLLVVHGQGNCFGRARKVQDELLMGKRRLGGGQQNSQHGNRADQGQAECGGSIGIGFTAYTRMMQRAALWLTPSCALCRHARERIAVWHWCRRRRERGRGEEV